MPATQFICSDGGKIGIAECLNQCRIPQNHPAGRCLSLRTLRAIADQREWTGIPSTTQLLKGVREAYLELVTDYAINPQDALFRVHGSKVHDYLDKFVDDNELGEERLYDDICSGQFDFYDTETQTIYDTKTWGSYKVMKALGYKQVEVETGEVYKSGAKKGQKKTRKEIIVGDEPDLFNEEMQLNDYRIKLEAAGFMVKQMFIEALIRDGNTYIAQSRGITANGVLIPVRRLPDEEVQQYFSSKRDALIHALETKEMPPRCSERESWDGRKCQRYCNVRDVCKGV